MVPAGVAAPLAGVLTDRLPRRDVLLASLAVRAALLLVMAAAIAAAAPIAVVLALAALFTIASTAHKPAQAALIPTLAESPKQLAACNALWSAIDNAAFLVGALIGGALVALASVDFAFVVTALLYALAIVPVLGIARDRVPAYRADAGAAGALENWIGGFRATVRDRDLRLIVGFLSLSTLVEGAVDVLVVVVAIELLDLGGAGVGWLNAAWGLGGLVGGGFALSVLGRGRLTVGLASGGLMIGAALIVVAAVGSAPVAVAMLVLLGVGYALTEIAGLSLLQRLNSDQVLGRAFAVVESSYWITTGLGALAAPALVALLGPHGALLAVGACLPVVVALRWAALARFEADASVPEREFRALRDLPVFAPLPMATIENVARRVVGVRVEPGQVVIREGDRGCSFYVVAEGVLDVSRSEGTSAAVAGGDFFGEIALLRDIPRTATVTARSDALLYELERDAFMMAVSAHSCCAEAVRSVAELRVAGGHAS
jgi:MFS family permease